MNIPREKLMMLSIEQLSALNAAVVAAIKDKRSSAAYEIKYTLNVGATVSYKSKKQGCVVFGKVVEIKQTRAHVKGNADGRVWIVPMSILKVHAPTDKPSTANAGFSF